MPDELVSYVDDDVLAEKLSTEFGPTPVVDKWDAADATEEGTEGLFTRGRAEYADDVREACAKFAIDDPTVDSGVNTPNLQHHPLLKNAVRQAANDSMLEQFADERMYTSILVPKWDPDYAVREIERVGGEDTVVAAYSWVDPKVPWGAEQLGPVFEALVDNDLPVLLHGSLAYWPQHSYTGDETLTWTEILGFDWPIHGIVNGPVPG
jgi:predicted TIM-barrel fold metal-dependent hydrolase